MCLYSFLGYDKRTGRYRTKYPLFISLGVFLALLYKRYNCIKKVVLIGFLFSLSIELVQMFECGATDINDLITNTLGALVALLQSGQPAQASVTDPMENEDLDKAMDFINSL